MSLDQQQPQESITALVVNYKTPDLIRGCVEHFVSTYPDVGFIVIDNGSEDESTAFIRDLPNQFPQVETILNPTNRYHGPALDQGIGRVKTRFVYTMDSDTIVERPGLLERMLESAEARDAYAVGRVQRKNWLGYDVGPDVPNFIPYVDPCGMLIDVATYLRLPPFRHHGAPCLHNMRAAVKQGLSIVDFPLFDYVQHIGRGTAARHGYGFGLRAQWEHYLNKLLRCLGRA